MTLSSVVDGDVASKILASHSEERRRHTRNLYHKPVTVLFGGGVEIQRIPAKPFNFSLTGLCIDVVEGPLFKVGSPIRLEMTPFEKTRQIMGTITRASYMQNDRWNYAVRFDEILENDRQVSMKRLRRVASIAFVIAGIAAILVFKITDLRWFWYAPFYRLYGILGGAFFISRALLSLFYRAPKDHGYMPKVSVIVSVKNEEAHITETVKRIFGVRYPLSKLELIVIDDGSTDNTWDRLQSVKDDYERLRLFRFPKNLGKRHGMALGAKEASGDILVYVDSDSYLDEEGIYKLVQPFHDRSVGAVAGHTRVIIEEKNIISKMESVRYFISHQFFKTAESLFGAVTCCPGAFSAYRRDVVLRVLPQWLNQSFMGVKSTFGDDRSLTNHVLRTHRVLYHSDAICVTYVPDTWKKFFTQQLRWKKSWARETTVASRILIRKHPIAALSYYIGIIVTLLSPLVFLRAVFIGPILFGQSCVPYLLGVLLVYLFLCLFHLFQTGESHWPHGLLFAGCYLTILCWQTYFAICSVNKTQWGTR